LVGEEHQQGRKGLLVGEEHQPRRKHNVLITFTKKTFLSLIEFNGGIVLYVQNKTPTDRQRKAISSLID
jgi:hypothetical protein